MKEYVITINNHPYNVIIKKINPDSAIIEVNGKEYEVGVERKLKRNLEPLEIKPVIKSAPETEPKRRLSTKSTVAAMGDISAPLPGLILQILAKTGDVVSKGQTLLKMEAMKMENEIKANKDGKVHKVYVEEGDTVQENTPLVAIGE